ncbi:MAG: hypothetical protein RPU15_11860 [Candidatus Sedimenticola sp. (ex Thyasira tokunagai)]
MMPHRMAKKHKAGNIWYSCSAAKNAWNESSMAHAPDGGEYASA